MIEKINQVARPADISAERANRLRQSPDLNIDAPVHLEVVNCATPVSAQHAGSVCVVNHHNGAVFLSQIAQPG